jgi:hypothetical protein
MTRTLISWRWLARALGIVLLVGTLAAHAGQGDHERARKALEAGEVLPLKTILERLESAFPGQVLDVELERESDGPHQGGTVRWVYKLKVLRPGGALVKFKVDARDGTVLGSQSRAHPPGDREHGRHRPEQGDR